MTATPAGMTYAEYLHLDTLLSAQHPISDLHDEMLFVIIHQTKELWLKQMLHEVGFACRLVREDKFAEAYKALSRVSRIWTVMTLSWDVLATLTPVDYSAFRDVLGSSSGFQSAQFRELEYRLGIKDPRFLNYYEGGTEGHALVINDQLYFQSDHVAGADGKQPWTDLPPAWPHAFELFLDALTGQANVPLVSAHEAAVRSAVMGALYEGHARQTWIAPSTG